IYGSVLSDEDIKDVINEAPADIVASLPRTLPQPVHQWLMNGSAADTGSNPKDGSLDSYVSFVNDSAWGQTLNVDMSAAPYQLSAPYGFNANGPSETLSAMTVSMWVKQDPAQTADAFRYLLGSADFSVGLNGNGALNFGLTDFVGKPYTYDSWGNVSSDPGSFGSDKAGSWHLITYTYGDGQLVFYVDGVSVGTVAADQYDINMDNITIGDDGWQSHAYQGGVADVRIYDSVLSAADVASLAVNLAIPGAKPAAAPAGWWKLDAVDTANNTTRDEITGSDDWVQAPPLTVVNDPVRGNVLNSSGTGCSGWFSALGRDWSFASYTASIWMKLDAGAGNADVLSLGNGGDGSASPAETLHLNVNSDGSTVSLLQTYKEAGYWQPEKCILSYTLPNGGDLRGAWHNLAFTVSGNDIKLYIDGELAQDFSNTSYDAAMTIQMLTVGSFDPTYGTDAAVAVGGVYSGRLSDFRVYGYALNADNILYIANGGADYGDGDISNAGALKLSAQTSKPNTNLFTQDGSPDYIDVTVSNIGAYQGTSFDVDWTITDWNGNTTGSGALTFQQADGDVQTQEIPVDKSRLGWFSFVPTIGNGAVKLPNPNPNWGGLTNNLPYSIVADPSARRENGTYDWSFNATGVASSGTLSGAVDNGKPYQIMNGTVDAGVTLSQNGKGIDNYTYFGIVNAPPSPMPDGVDIRKLLGATVSTTSSMSWAYFFTDNNASGTPQTDVNELNIFANPGTQVSLYGEPLDYVGNLLRSPLYQVLELTPYFDNAFRIPGANGAYGGTMSAYGEEQFVNYIKGMCEIQIAQAPLRPHDYFQILWEPVDWWGAWLPAGPVGDQGIVRAYQLAYQTIHQIYDDQAVAT
ncbi:MAG: LamG domain-containing protein, partial [Defluviitaleaceae bacterium]|nr:LamG domain-containing protein [Defluviitaleaceae bacterium]